MKFKKILLIDVDDAKLNKKYWDKINSFCNKKVYVPKESLQIQKELSDTDCILVNFGNFVTKEMIDTAPDLKYIGTFSTAYGKVDDKHAREKGIIVCNLPGFSSESVAEFTIAVILENIRGLEEGKQRGRNKNVDESGIKAWEIKNKIFGVVGLGNIGKRVAELASGFGANVRYWSREKKQSPFKYEDADMLIAESDFLSINLAQNKDTENFLNKDRVNKLKKGCVVINTAPMELVDIDALVNRLAKSDMTFILDHSDEMTNEDLDKISKYSNCIIYPPMAYITDEALQNKKEMFVSNIENFLKGSPINVVSP